MTYDPARDALRIAIPDAKRAALYLNDDAIPPR